MNRRKFNSATFIGLFGLTTCQSTLAQSLITERQESFTTLKDAKGLLLKLYKKQFATKDLDQAQYILTFDVFNHESDLEEKIYQLTDDQGKKHDIFMTPVNQNQLQAVFNHRTYA